MTETIHNELTDGTNPVYDIWKRTSISGDYAAAKLGDEPETQEDSDLIETLEGLSGKPVTMEYTRTKDGVYIGDVKRAKLLCDERGIVPEKADPADSICTIGFCEKEQKWYGWSHRAIYGFGIGDVVEEGDSAATSGWTDDYLAAHPEADRRVPVGFEAKTLDDAKRIAIAFAESVS